jgi:hypothetical protein
MSGIEWKFDGKTLTNGKHSFSAHSGNFSGIFNENIKNLGPIPDGRWEASNCGIRTSDIYRCDLSPIGNTDPKGRTNLQIHDRSNQSVHIPFTDTEWKWKSDLNMDSMGCIATNGAPFVKNGDIINVQKK